MKKSLVLCFVSMLMLVCPLANAKKEALPGVPLEKYYVDWDNMTPTQKANIKKSICAPFDEQSAASDKYPCSASWRLYFVDLNDDNIQDVIVREDAGTAACTHYSAYLGTPKGYSPQDYILFFTDGPDCAAYGFDKNGLKVYYDDFDVSIRLLNSKTNGMRDIFNITKIRNGKNAKTYKKVLKYGWKKNDQGEKYAAYF